MIYYLYESPAKQLYLTDNISDKDNKIKVFFPFIDIHGLSGVMTKSRINDSNLIKKQNTKFTLDDLINLIETK